ncbi:epithelial cell-transforming sequence 2 oncogene-like [Sycon ciliatum]|uniref:epithelial cell-transforming sequence 2 oncogene-like n=1 Tax=Sycon ciliatum TaxID=27933 RepID=UPI0031F6D97C
MAAKHRTTPTFGLSSAHNSMSVGSKAHFSAWTPVNHMPSNEQLYQERRALIGHWYDMWTHGQRQEFLKFVLGRSTARQQRYAFDLLDVAVPPERQDFVSVLPRNLTLYIFSFLDARSLCRAAVVNWHWHFLAEQDSLWQPKCTRYGWFLPYTPGDKEYGAWKRHYVACLNTLDRSAPNKQIALLYSTLGGLPAASTAEHATKTPGKKKQHKERSSSSPSKSLGPTALATYRNRPWLDPDPKPHDLEKGWKAMQLSGAIPPGQSRGMHHSTFSAVSKTYSLASAATLAGTAALDGVQGAQDDEDMMLSSSSGAGGEASRSTLVTLTDVLRQQASGAYDSVALAKTWPVYTGPRESSGFDGTASGSMSFYSHYKHDMRALVQRYPSHSHPSIILISSQIPATELLLEGLIFGVLPLIYDYDSSTIESLVERLDWLLAGRQARGIGLFLEASEGELQIVSGETATSTNLSSETNQRFLWESLCSRCIPSHDGGRLDIFAALASNAQGMELLNALQRFTGYQISATRSITNKREFVDSDWVIVQDKSPQSDLSPPALYFNMKTLATWTNTCLYLENASSTTTSLLKSYLSLQRKDLVHKTVGKVLIEALSLHQVAAISRKLSRTLTKAVTAVAREDLKSTSDIVQRFASYFASLQHQSSSPTLLFSESNRRPESLTNTPVIGRRSSMSFSTPTATASGAVAGKGKGTSHHTAADAHDSDTQSQASVSRQSSEAESEMDQAPVPPANPESPFISPQSKFPGNDSTFRLSLSSQPVPGLAASTGGRRTSTGPRIVSFDDAGSHEWMEQRHNVAIEIGRTEKVYRRCLLAIHENFHVPLKNAVITGKAIISVTNIELIFTDTGVLLQISKQTDGNLQSKLNDWSAYQCLGDVFSCFTSSLQSYVNFANNYPTTLATIMRCRDESPAFQAFLKQQTGQPQTAMLNLFELLLLPGQRIVSYLHLLNTFKVLTPPDHPDHQLLDVSITRLERMKTIMFEAKERSMRERRLHSLQNTIIGSPILEEGHRYLLYEETFQHLVHCNYGKSHRGQSNDGPIYQHIGDIGAFLLTDSLLLTNIETRHFPFERATSTAHHYSACFALDSLQLVDMMDSKHVRHCFTLATGDGKHRWVCRAASRDIKIAFIAAVQKATESLQPLQY